MLIEKAEAGRSAAGAQADDVQACLRVLGQMRDTPGLADEWPELGRAVARAYKDVRKERRRQSERANRRDDRAKVERTRRCAKEPRPAEMLVADQGRPEISAGEAAELNKPRSCYVCKNDFLRLHSFYHLLCPDCAAENFARRSARSDLRGRRALVTGGRIKIGYETCLKLLRDGAEVIVTTRFPRDAACRYAREKDFADWGGRLTIYGLELRDLPGVYAFTRHVRQRFESLDILINNAAQTIRRESEFFAGLYEAEATPVERLPVAARKLLGDAPAERDGENAMEFSLVSRESCEWPDDVAYDASGRPRDARERNSWLLEMGEVPAAELAEVMLINAMSPFVLCGQLEPMLSRSRFVDRYIVNVSAMEGRFARGTKTPRHPHTNMAKAALNMLTRTAGGRLAEKGIFMNSVDTGWVTEENPHPKRARLRARGFVPPLDEIDGAARVYDPILRGIGGEKLAGLFLKDYRAVSW